MMKYEIDLITNNGVAEYRDLIVPIEGYSDYFTKLSPKMQEELILRTAHPI